MTKRIITIWWLIGTGVLVVGGLLALFSSLALASHIGAFTGDLQPGVNYIPDGTFWGLVSLILLGGFAFLAGMVIQFVAWIGAVTNTNRLMDKTWFNILLWCGIVGIVLGPFFGLGALLWWGLMIAYLVGGPDGTAVEPMMFKTTPAEPPRPLAPTEPPRPLAPTG